MAAGPVDSVPLPPSYYHRNHHTKSRIHRLFTGETDPYSKYPHLPCFVRLEAYPSELLEAKMRCRGWIVWLLAMALMVIGKERRRCRERRGGDVVKGEEEEKRGGDLMRGEKEKRRRREERRTREGRGREGRGGEKEVAKAIERRRGGRGGRRPEG
eukprot:548998-Hanusia_phi.AAC.4